MKFSKALLRALEWRAVSVCVDFAVVFLLTGKFTLSLGIITISNTVRTVVHALWIKHRAQDSA